jgi:hypothetical protein
MSQSDGTTYEVNGHTYRSYMLEPLKSGRLLLKVIKAFAPSIGAIGATMLSRKDSAGAIQDLLDGAPDEAGKAAFGAAFERALVGLVDRLHADEIEELIEALADDSITQVKIGSEWAGLRSQLTVHFRGKPLAMYSWLWKAMSAQWADFSDDAGSAIDHVLRRAANG